MVSTYWTVLWTTVRARIEMLRKEPEAGEVTTTVLVIALLAIATITIVGIIVAKLVAKANSIDLGS